MSDRLCANPDCRCKLSAYNPGKLCLPCQGAAAGLTDDDYPLAEHGFNGDALAEAIEGAALHVTKPDRAGVRKPRPVTGSRENWRKVEALNPPVPDHLRRVALLYLVGGHTLKGAARILGITAEAARKRWERLRTLLGADSRPSSRAHKGQGRRLSS